MGAKGLGSRAIIGEFFHRLSQDLGNTWIPALSMLFDSDQESETYKWLGMSPQMREWVGERMAKGLREQGITIKNLTFEATMEVLVDEIRRDKTGQVMLRVAEMATRTNSHWAKLLSTLILNGASGVCYDGQYFFDTDHSEGDSGTQSNDLTSAIVSNTAPTTLEMANAIFACVQAILGFLDNQGEPMNENANEFLVMVPIPFLKAANAALSNQYIQGTGGAIDNTLASSGFNIRAVANPRLSWTDAFSVFRTDGDVKPFIRQEEEAVSIAAIAEGSELEFKHNKHQYGVKAIRNVGYGYWQKACLYTFTTA